MRTNTITLAAVLSIALVVVPGAVAAQAPDEELAAPSYWTSTETEGPHFLIPGVEIEFFPWGYRNTIGLTATSEADDPRVSGDLTVAYVMDWSDKYAVGRGTGLVRLVNEGGTFEGPLYVVYYPDGSEFRMALMEGQDGYEGLTSTMTNFISPSGEGQPQGLIWEGEAPPVLDADVLPE